jgi:hypothetical protein
MFAQTEPSAALDGRLEVRVNAAGFPVVIRKGEKWSATSSAESKADAASSAAAAKGELRSKS